MQTMNNHKTSILAIVTGSILFSSSFAIGANSHRLESPTDRTSNFVYPKVDEIAPIEQQTATTEPTQKERTTRRRKTITATATATTTTTKRNSIAALTTAVPQQHNRITRSSRKMHVRKTETSVAIPVSPANEQPLEDDNNDISTPVAITEKASPLSNEATQPDRKQQVQKDDAPKEVRAEIKQVKKEEKEEINQPKKEEKIATKSSPSKSEKEVEIEPPAPSEPFTPDP